MFGSIVSFVMTVPAARPNIWRSNVLYYKTFCASLHQFMQKFVIKQYRFTQDYLEKLQSDAFVGFRVVHFVRFNVNSFLRSNFCEDDSLLGHRARTEKEITRERALKVLKDSPVVAPLRLGESLGFSRFLLEDR